MLLVSGKVVVALALAATFAANAACDAAFSVAVVWFKVFSCNELALVLALVVALFSAVAVAVAVGVVVADSVVIPDVSSVPVFEVVALRFSVAVLSAAALSFVAEFVRAVLLVVGSALASVEEVATA